MTWQWSARPRPTCPCALRAGTTRCKGAWRCVCSRSCSLHARPQPLHAQCCPPPPCLCCTALQIQIGGQWGAVCGAGAPSAMFDNKAAGVVCHKLGLGTRGWAVPASRYRPSTLPIHIADVQCVGSEKELSACRYSTAGAGSMPVCTHAHDVGVACPKPNIGGINL